MEISPLDLNRLAGAPAAADAALQSTTRLPSELGREDFLRLLLAKLENQDPLSPSQDTEFIAELATFSSLEQLIGVNDNLQGLALGQADLINAQALNLIGKQALVTGDGMIQVRGGVPDGIAYALPAAAREARLTIYGSDGAPVRTFDLQTTPGGRVLLPWDGSDARGNALPDGEYRVEVVATDLDGKPMEVALYESLTIDGVSFGAGGIALVSGGREIPFESIIEFRSASAAAASASRNPSQKQVTNVP